ncbi:phytanoyl-CoA dioxygenase family protein [Pseudoalteromonas sp. MMG005]|nr:phytanoyl-CoA dioxygenase family protein [Pseudoalteromonas sp. MMG005]
MDVTLEFEKSGFAVIRNALTAKELAPIKEATQYYHKLWKKKNDEAYKNGAINSAYLTHQAHLPEGKRAILFNVIGSHKLRHIIDDTLGPDAAFMNTQLFFDPLNPNQANYWHRDSQYHLTIEEQKLALTGPNVVHYRVALTDDPGVELVPETHKRWDRNGELDIRLQKNGHTNDEEIEGAVKISLKAGDILVFFANMIHRGLYGKNRFALDILLCDPDPMFEKYISRDILPSELTLKELENPSLFVNTNVFIS